MQITKVREYISTKNETVQNSLRFKPIFKYILSFLGGFLMMNPFVLGQLSPFAISFTAAADGNCIFASAAGNIIGSFVFFDGTDTVKYSAAALLCVLISGLCRRYLAAELIPVSSYINAFLSMLMTGASIMLATGYNTEELLTVLFEAFVASAGTYLFAIAVELAWSSKEFSKFKAGETIAVLLAAAIFLMSFEKYRIFGFSPVKTVFACLILLSCITRHSSGGALCGICMGLAAGLNGEIGYVCLGYAMSGLLGGELARKGKAYCAAGCLAPIIITAAADGSLGAYMTIAEEIVACGAFLAVPQHLYQKLSEKINSPQPVQIKSDEGQKLKKRLTDASDAIVHVSDCVNKVQTSLYPLTQTGLNQVVKTAWEKICSECDLRESCRPEVKTPTAQTLDKLAQALSDGAPLDETRFPKGFFTACYCFEEMRSEMNRRYLSFVASRGAQGKVSQVQSMMSDQFKGMADILRDLACDFDENISENEELAELCADEAREFGLDVISADSRFDKYGRVCVSLTVSRPRENFNVTAFTKSLSAGTGKNLDLPELEDNGDCCTFKFNQLISCAAEVGACSRPTDGEEICGDYYSSFRDANGRHIAVISDGMGTGTRAAVDSAMAAELFSKLVKSGMSFDCALPIANSALLVKSTDESLATLDVVCIDLYTGRTDFMKAGAAATFIRHRGSVAQLEQASLPIGILRDISFTKATAALEKGDIILMISDGILGECNGWIQQELKLWDTSRTPQELADFIVNSACERKLAKHRDDMTAMAICIK